MKKMTLNELKIYVKDQAQKLYENWQDQASEEDMFNQQHREYVEKLRALRMKTPIDKVIEFFKHFKIDADKLNPDILRQIFVVWEDEANYEGVSDMEDGKDGSVSVELDGIYGKHWMSFENHQDWNRYYQENILSEARAEFEKLYKEYSMKLSAKKGDFKNSGNALGNNLSPEMLNKLKGIK